MGRNVNPWSRSARSSFLLIIVRSWKVQLRIGEPLEGLTPMDVSASALPCQFLGFLCCHDSNLRVLIFSVKFLENSCFLSIMRYT